MMLASIDFRPGFVSSPLPRRREISVIKLAKLEKDLKSKLIEKIKKAVAMQP
jgi:hypothetical protein